MYHYIKDIEERSKKKDDGVWPAAGHLRTKRHRLCQTLLLLGVTFIDIIYTSSSVAKVFHFLALHRYSIYPSLSLYYVFLVIFLVLSSTTPTENLGARDDLHLSPAGRPRKSHPLKPKDPERHLAGPHVQPCADVSKLFTHPHTYIYIYIYTVLPKRKTGSSSSIYIKRKKIKETKK